MYPVIVIFIFCFAGAFAGAKDDLLFAKNVSDSCLIEHNINPELLQDGNEGSLTLNQIYCIAACYYRDQKIMRPDGTIDLNRVSEIYDEDNDALGKEQFFKLHSKCQDKFDCKLVQCMIQELVYEIGKDSEKSSNDIRKNLFTARIFTQFTL